MAKGSSRSKRGTTAISRELALSLHKFMLRTYLFEENLHMMYRRGEILGGLYTGSGNEAVCVGAAAVLEQGDVIAPSHRGMGAHFVRGETMRGMMLQLLARAEGGTRGRDNAAHQGSMERGVIGMISHLCTTATTAAGCALAHKMKKNSRVAMGFVGEGTTSLGDFHETMNMSAVLGLPFIMIIENNQYAYSTPHHKQYRCERLADRATGYGIPGVTIDGTDVELIYQTVAEAVQRARRGEGPSLIETVTFRLRGHSAADMGQYVPKGLVQEWEAKHPVKLYTAKLLERGWLTEQAQSELEEEIKREIEDAVTYATAQPLPEPHTALDGVYAE